MPNMSYCRFENTSTDLIDCLEAIERGEGDPSNLTEYEQRGLVSLIQSSRRLVEIVDSGEWEGSEIEELIAEV